MLGKISADNMMKNFSYFSQKTGFDISMSVPVFWEKYETYHRCLLNQPRDKVKINIYIYFRENFWSK